MWSEFFSLSHILRFHSNEFHLYIKILMFYSVVVLKHIKHVHLYLIVEQKE